MMNTFIFLTLIFVSLFTNAQTYIEQQADSNPNPILNPGFENNLANWVRTGGSTAFIAPSSPFHIDGAKTLSFAGISGNSLKSKLVTIPGSMRGQNCAGRFKYKGMDSSTIAYVENGDGEQISSTFTLSASTETRQVEMTFVCPTQAEITADADKGNLRITILWASTVTGYVDSFGLGLNQNVGMIAQAEKILVAERTTPQSVAATTETVVTATAETDDPYNAFSSGIYTVSKKGFYWMSVTIQVANTTAIEQFFFRWRYNNTTYTTCFNITLPAAGSETVTVACGYPANVGDTFRATIQSTADTAYDVSLARFSMSFIPDSLSLVISNNVPSYPTQTRYTTAGSGTYTTPAGVKYLRVRMSAGGGGGGGSSALANGNGGNGGAGGNTTFGTSLLSTTGGAGGLGGTTYTGGLGGTGTVTAPAVGYNLGGGNGGSGQQTTTAVASIGGVGGGGAIWNGAGGGGGLGSGAGRDARGNSGGAGGGGGGGQSTYSGGGGGAGGSIEAFIFSPLTTYSYTVGIAGTAGTAGTGGAAGGAGSVGVIEITEFYGVDEPNLVKQSVVYDTAVKAEGFGGVTTVAHGTYTPSLSNGVNTSGVPTANSFNWIRIGNIVSVSGSFVIQCTAASDTATEVNLSLPVATTFSSVSHLNGNLTGYSTPGEVGVISYSGTYPTVARAYWFCKTASSVTRRVQFSYSIQ